MNIQSSPPSQPRLSIIVPAKDEAANLATLIPEIGTTLAQSSFELIVVDDGSSDETEALVAALRRDGCYWLSLIRHDKSCGQSRSVRTGMLAASGEIVVTIDGDGQNDPAYIPKLVAALDETDDGVAMISGQRTGRKASALKRFSSRFANGLRRGVLRDGALDSGCGLRAIRRDVFLRLPYFDSWHRFMPVLVIREGYRVRYVDVVDRPRRHGRSKYGILNRGLIGALDLFGVWWLKRRARHIPVVTRVETMSDVR